MNSLRFRPTPLGGWALLLFALVSIQSGCASHSLRSEVKDYYELTRRNDAALALLTEIASIDEATRFRSQLEGTSKSDEISMAGGARCLQPADNERRRAAIDQLNAFDRCGPDATCRAALRAQSPEPLYASPRRRFEEIQSKLLNVADCSTIACFEAIRTGAPRLTASSISETHDPEELAQRVQRALDCPKPGSAKDDACIREAGLVFERPSDPRDCDLELEFAQDPTARSRPLSEHSPVLDNLEIARAESREILRFASGLDALARGESASEVNAALRSVSFPTKVSVAALQEEPSQELSQVDAVTGLMMDLFRGIFEFRKNKELDQLVSRARPAIDEATWLMKHRTAPLQNAVGTELANHVSRALDALNQAARDRTPVAPAIRDAKIETAYTTLRASRDAYALFTASPIDATLEALDGATDALTHLASKPTGPSIFSKKQRRRYQAQRARLNQSLAQADETYEALIQVRDWFRLATRSPSKSTHPNE